MAMLPWRLIGDDRNEQRLVEAQLNIPTQGLHKVELAQATFHEGHRSHTVR
jgi:hypothetical protein